MENEVQPITPPTQSLPQTPTLAPVPTPPSTNWAIIRLLSVLGFFVVAGAVLIGVQVGKKQTTDHQPVVEEPTATPTQTVVNPTVVPTANPTTDPTSNWKTYTIPQFGIVFSYPDFLTPLDYPNGLETQGETGTQLCLSLIASTTSFNLVKPVLAGGGGCQGLFAVGSTSTNYTEGREGGFGDLQGYSKENNKFIANFVSNGKIELKLELVNEITNRNGVKILIVQGKNSTEFVERGSIPIQGTPGEGMIGALINTKGGLYRGFNVQMKLSKQFSQEVFNQILSTFKFTN